MRTNTFTFLYFLISRLPCIMLASGPLGARPPLYQSMMERGAQTALQQSVSKACGANNSAFGSHVGNLSSKGPEPSIVKARRLP